jgi:long-chain acyl-CoA synthetase
MYPGAYISQFPDKPAAIVAETGKQVTYGELEDRSWRLACHLYGAGLRPGDHIALLTDNDPTAFEVYWAALRSGLHITAVNWHLTAVEAAYIIDDCGARALIAAASLAEPAAALVADTPKLELRFAFGGEIGGYDSYEAVLEQPVTTPLPSQPAGTDMLYSSGTTGRPKGVQQPLPDRQVDEPGWLYVDIFKPMYGFDSDTVYLSPAPLYHAAPLRFGGVVQACGGTVVLLERFDPKLALAAIERFHVTHSQWVPTMFVRMLKLPEAERRAHDLSSLQVAIHAAAPCPAEVKRAMIDWWGPILYEYYSSTEANGITFIDSEQWLARPGSVGVPALGVIHVCDDDDGGERPAGEIGTVFFERDVTPFEYHNDPGQSRSAQHPAHANWTTTGDVGYVDEDGYLFLTDRKAFMIISGGVNIYPQEIENLLALHPSVLDVAVIGVPDPEMGESVLAVVAPAAGATAGEQLATELTAYLRERIAGYKLPRRFKFDADLPRTPTGKLVKRELQRRYG